MLAMTSSRMAQPIPEKKGGHALGPSTPSHPFLKLWPSNTPERRRKLEAELPVELADRVWGFVYGEPSATEKAQENIFLII